ncbi:hypothetical protein MASR2M47_35560 [Draconibacterium sp.]
MENKYVNFVSDDHLLTCIGNLHKSYIKAKNNITKKNFYSNKVDTIKLTFDAKFNEINEESLIQSEILRQIDKSINNSIGTFHEQVLGGIKGFEVGFLSGFDIKAEDDTLFADIKNKHNTMNSSAAEALFQKLARYADDFKKAKCYWVRFWQRGVFVNYGLEISTVKNTAIAGFIKFQAINFMLCFRDKMTRYSNFTKLYLPQLRII